MEHPRTGKNGCRVDELLLDRVTAILVTPYPPGIPLLLPGERFNKDNRRLTSSSPANSTQMPGFDTDVHGQMVMEHDERVERYFVDCVKA